MTFGKEYWSRAMQAGGWKGQSAEGEEQEKKIEEMRDQAARKGWATLERIEERVGNIEGKRQQVELDRAQAGLTMLEKIEKKIDNIEGMKEKIEMMERSLAYLLDNPDGEPPGGEPPLRTKRPAEQVLLLDEDGSTKGWTTNPEGVKRRQASDSCLGWL